MFFRRYLIPAALLVALSVAAYSGVMDNGFVWDDAAQIVQNPYLRPGHSWKPLFAGDVWSYGLGGLPVSNYYRPLQLVTYRLTEQVAGLHAGAFHAVSLAFAILAALAAYLLMLQLTGRIGVSLAGAALFAVHPEHSEAVAWIAALPDVACAFFSFLSLWLFLLAWQPKEAIVPASVSKSKQKKIAKQAAAQGDPALRRGLLYLGSVLAFAAALLWKEMALTLPALIVLYVLLFPRDARWTARVREAALKSWPYWATVAAYVALRFKVLGYFSKVQFAWKMSPWQFLLSVCELLAKYWLKLLLPFGLRAWHPFTPAASAPGATGVAALVLLVIAVALLWYAVRRAALAAFAAAWVFVTLVPVLNVRALGENAFAERYLYLPSFGFCLLLAWLGAKALAQLEAFGRVPRPVWVATGATALIAVACVAETRARIPVWHDDYALFTRSAEQAPESGQMHELLAQTLLKRGDVSGAEREYQSALQIALAAVRPGDTRIASAYLGLGRVYLAEKQYQRALETIDRGLATNTYLKGLYSFRGEALIRLGRYNEAQQQLEATLRTYPNDVLTINNLAKLAVLHRDYPRAIEYYRMAVGIDPTLAASYNNLAYCYIESGDIPASVAPLQQAVELEPNSAEYHTNLGMALAQTKRFDEAEGQFVAALQIDPNYARAKENLAVLQMQVQPR